MAIRFGVFVPQGWRLDLAEIEDPIEKYEAMTKAAKAADQEELQTLVDAGIDYFILTIPRNAYDHEPQTRFAREVVPMFTR